MGSLVKDLHVYKHIQSIQFVILGKDFSGKQMYHNLFNQILID